MTKKEIITELDKRLRMYESYIEHWHNIATYSKNNSESDTAVVVREYYKGKAHATSEAIKVITGER